jgi:hypothetical protein
MYADDTSVLAYNKNYNELMREFDVITSHISECFLANQVTVNIDKTCVVKFIHTVRLLYHLTVAYTGRKLTEVTDLKFLGFFIDDNLN